MRFTVVTILPELIEPSLTAGVVGRAREAGTITVDAVNPRDFTHDRHRTVDDNPYGGGPGMVMKAEPLLAAIARASEPPPGSDVEAPDRIATSTEAPRTTHAPEQVASSLESDADDITTTLRFKRPTPAIPADDITTTRPFTRPPRRPADDVSSSLASVESSIDKLEHALDGNLDALVAQDALETATETSSTKSAVGAHIKPGATSAIGAEIKPGAIGADIKSGSSKSGSIGADIEPGSIGADIEPGEDIESSIDKLEHALDGNLDALVAQDALEAATEGSPSTSSIGAEIKPREIGSMGAEIKPRAIGAMGADIKPSATGPAAGATTAIGAEIKIDAPRRAHRILLSPSGKPLTQARVRELAQLPHLVLVCGRYEGIDQRVIDAAIDEEISIGDFVLSGGELGALVIIDAVSRYVPGVLGAADSVDEESFSAGMLEYPQYTRPPELAASHVPADRTIERTIPPILQSGNHAAIAAWRRKQSIERTAIRRPDLFRSFAPTKADAKLVPPLRKRTHLALVHHPVVDRVNTVITTALTNFDIHDLARSTMTFGLAGYHIVTPITSQREKAEHIAKLWSEDEQGEHRAAALRLIRTAASVEDTIATITADHGGLAPIVVATSAKSTSFPAALRRTTTELLAETASQPTPVLILLGTGWGLADWLIPSVSRVLAPIEGGSDWNHLSVRSAGAIILDRLFGRPA